MARVTQVTVTATVHKLALVRYNSVETPIMSVTVLVEEGEDPVEAVQSFIEMFKGVRGVLIDEAIREHLTELVEHAEAPTCHDARKLLEGFKESVVKNPFPDMPDPNRPPPTGFRVKSRSSR